MAVKAVIFDLYGTILNIDSMRTHVAAAGIENADAFVAYWRRKQIEYAFLTTIVGAYSDFDDLTLRSLVHSCPEHGYILDGTHISNLMAAWQTMPAYPDVAPALATLAARGFPAAVLTNGTPASANRALEHAGIRHLLADVLSVEAVRAYKPDPRVYALATERFACAADEIVFVSSNGWDAWGAVQAGFHVAWCNRAGHAHEGLANTGRGAVRMEERLKGLDELEAFVAALSGNDIDTLRPVE
jgi:2-haloacid dehalogenase